MDVDMMKQSSSSSSGDQEHLDMMSIMMQMEKLPDFCNPFYNTSTTSAALQEIQFSSNGPSNPTIYPSSSSSSMPFIGTTTAPVEELPLNILPPQPNMAPAGTKFKYPSPLFSSNPNSFISSSSIEKNNNSMAAMREMIFRIAVMQPIHIDPESIKPPKRRNVKISKDPQSVAARHRRERISERIRILQRLVPGGTKMDTASMLDEAIHYVKFLKKQVKSLEEAGANRPMGAFGSFQGMPTNNVGYSSNFFKNCQPIGNMVTPMQMQYR